MFSWGIEKGQCLEKCESTLKQCPSSVISEILGHLL